MKGSSSCWKPETTKSNWNKHIHTLECTGKGNYVIIKDDEINISSFSFYELIKSQFYKTIFYKCNMVK